MDDLKVAVFRRDGWKCRKCKYRQDLHAHHVDFRSQGGPDAMNNLLTLCAACHRAVHDKNLTIIVQSVTEDNLVVVFVVKKGWKPK